MDTLQRKIQTRKFSLQHGSNSAPMRGNVEVQPAEASHVASDWTRGMDEDRRVFFENWQEADEYRVNNGYFPIASDRKVIGGLIVFCKRAVRKVLHKLLGWYIIPAYDRQSHYNGKIVNSVRMQQAMIDSCRAQIEAIYQKLGAFQTETFIRRADALETGIAEMFARADSLAQEVSQLKKDVESLAYNEGQLKEHMGALEREKDQLIARGNMLLDRTDKLFLRDDTLSARIETLAERSDLLANRSDNLSNRIEAEGQRVDVLQRNRDELYGMSYKLSERIDHLTVDLDEFSVQIKKVDEEEAKLSKQLEDIAGIPTKDDAFYHEFEERYRGTREDIRGRMDMYIQLVREHIPDWSKARFVDVGSGRGEWLDVLRYYGARDYVGVDLNERQNEIARSFSHTVVNADCVEYLKSLPDGSLDMVSGFQLIEHLSLRNLQCLLEECYRTLKKGGIILFETPNPRNLTVGADTFYSDPTHRRPIEPQLVEFMAGYCGFREVRSIESKTHPKSKSISVDQNGELKELTERVNDLSWSIFGPQDFALFAVKED